MQLPDHERPAMRSVVFVKALDQVPTEGTMTSRSKEATSTKNSDNLENCARRTLAPVQIRATQKNERTHVRKMLRLS